MKKWKGFFSGRTGKVDQGSVHWNGNCLQIKQKSQCSWSCRHVTLPGLTIWSGVVCHLSFVLNTNAVQCTLCFICHSQVIIIHQKKKKWDIFSLVAIKMKFCAPVCRVFIVTQSRSVSSCVLLQTEHRMMKLCTWGYYTCFVFLSASTSQRTLLFSWGLSSLGFCHQLQSTGLHTLKPVFIRLWTLYLVGKLVGRVINISYYFRWSILLIHSHKHQASWKEQKQMHSELGTTQQLKQCSREHVVGTA